VPVSVPVPGTGKPWVDAFGRSADDPAFDEYLEEVQYTLIAKGMNDEMQKGPRHAQSNDGCDE
jgi:hypothetical protein